jgi:hypothetical protein
MKVRTACNSNRFHSEAVTITYFVDTSTKAFTYPVGLFDIVLSETGGGLSRVTPNVT